MKRTRNDNKWNDKWTLIGCKIEAEGARMIIESLKTNTTLTSLNISGDNNGR